MSDIQIIAVSENQKEVEKFDFSGLKKNLER